MADVNTSLSATTSGYVHQGFPAKRFGPETFIIFISMSINVLGLYAVMSTHRKRQSVYHILYFNLAISNLVACPMTWLCNNMLFLFNDWFNEMLQTDFKCTTTVYMLAGVFVALSVGIQMTLAMLGLALAQYMAICRPLQSIYVLQKKRAYYFIPVAIVISLICAATPFGVLHSRSTTNACTNEIIGSIFRDVILGANILTVIIVILYLAMAVIGVRIYIEIRRHMKRKLELGGNVDVKKLHEDHRAFGTTMFLLLSLTLFFIPFTIYFVTKLNVDGVEKVAANVSIFYLTMMPCAKCIFDPIIYGARMRDVKATYTRLFLRCFRLSPDNEKTSYTSKSAPTSNNQSATAITKVGETTDVEKCDTRF